MLCFDILRTPLREKEDVLVTTAPKFIALTCVFIVALAMVLSVYYLMQKRSRHHDHDPLPPGEVAIRHGHGRDGRFASDRRARRYGWVNFHVAIEIENSET